MKPHYILTSHGPLLVGVKRSAADVADIAQQGMHPEQIKAELRIKGMTLTALADELGLSRSMVTHIIYGHARSKRVEERIAQLLKKPASAIWEQPRPVLRRTRMQVSAARTQVFPHPQGAKQ